MRNLKDKSFITKVVSLSAILLLLVIFCTGCNKQIVDLDYSFNKAICIIGNEVTELELKSWKDYEGEQLQLIDKNGNKYLVSSFNCTLIKDN